MAQIFNDENLPQVISGNKPVVVDFWATWCGPCRMIAPIVEQLAQEYEGRVEIGKYDVDEAGGDMAAEFGIRSIPTILFFKGGQQVDKQVGATSYEALKAKIDALL